jgi:hypothetical protein
VFLALSADDADEAGLPSGGTRLASYAVGLVSGAFNLSHWGMESAGLAFAFLSAISPFLWGVRARIRRNRVVAPSRRLWHPVRSVALIREMAWRGIATEEEALRLLAAAKREAPQESAVPPIEVEAEIAPAPERVLPPADAPAIERAPRVARARTNDRALLLAVDAIKDGRTPAEAAAASGMSVHAGMRPSCARCARTRTRRFRWRTCARTWSRASARGRRGASDAPARARGLRVRQRAGLPGALSAPGADRRRVPRRSHGGEPRVA